MTTRRIMRHKWRHMKLATARYQKYFHKVKIPIDFNTNPCFLVYFIRMFKPARVFLCNFLKISSYLSRSFTGIGSDFSCGHLLKTTLVFNFKFDVILKMWLLHIYLLDFNIITINTILYRRFLTKKYHKFSWEI